MRPIKHKQHTPCKGSFLKQPPITVSFSWKVENCWYNISGKRECKEKLSKKKMEKSYSYIAFQNEPKYILRQALWVDCSLQTFTNNFKQEWDTLKKRKCGWQQQLQWIHNQSEHSDQNYAQTIQNGTEAESKFCTR